ncbi:MAG: hypothetical protein ABSG32_25225 [Terriglobia bacterium]
MGSASALGRIPNAAAPAQCASDTDFDRVCLYLNRLPTEFHVLWVRGATLRQPAIRVEEEGVRRRSGLFGQQEY